VKQFGETNKSVLLLCWQTLTWGTNYTFSKNFGPLPQARQRALKNPRHLSCRSINTWL